jgi:hypothetical protein
LFAEIELEGVRWIFLFWVGFWGVVLWIGVGVLLGEVLILDLEGILLEIWCVDKILRHELDKCLLEDHFLGFLLFDIFFEVIFHGFNFFEYFPHQFDITSGHLLHP